MFFCVQEDFHSVTATSPLRGKQDKQPVVGPSEESLSNLKL
jgi:hypothetical protein